MSLSGLVFISVHHPGRMASVKGNSWVESKLQNIVQSHGQVIAVAADIGEEKGLKKKRRKARDNLEKQIRLKTE